MKQQNNKKLEKRQKYLREFINVFKNNSKKMILDIINGSLIPIRFTFLSPESLNWSVWENLPKIDLIFGIYWHNLDFKELYLVLELKFCLLQLYNALRLGLGGYSRQTIYRLNCFYWIYYVGVAAIRVFLFGFYFISFITP